MGIEVMGLGAAAMDVVMNCESLPGEDGFSVVHEEKIVPGGSCANVLVALANLGRKAGLIARMGDDSYGQAFVEDLKTAGVDCEYVTMRQGGVSLHTYIAVAGNGAKIVFSHMGNSLLALSEADMVSEMLDGVKVFYTDMLPGKPALKLARLCRKKGIPIVFNLQVEPDFMNQCGIWGSEIEEMLSLCQLFVTFRGGLAGLSESTDPISGAGLIHERWRPDMGVIVTLGHEGAVWVGNDQMLRVPSFAIEPVDTTGAGDAFAGALIHARLFKGLDCKQSLRFANACGAMKCMQPGPRWKGTERDVLNFLVDPKHLRGEEGGA